MLWSRYSSTDGALLSVAVSRSLTTLVMVVSVECRERYADGNGTTLGEASICRRCCFYMIRYGNFPMVLILVIGWKLVVSDVSSAGFLKSGVT